jgi:hypothetical protein
MLNVLGGVAGAVRTGRGYVTGPDPQIPGVRYALVANLVAAFPLGAGICTATVAVASAMCRQTTPPGLLPRLWHVTRAVLLDPFGNRYWSGLL